MARFKLREEFVIHLVTYIAYKSLNDWKIRLDLRYINRLIKDILNEFSLAGQINIDDAQIAWLMCKVYTGIKRLLSV